MTDIDWLTNINYQSNSSEPTTCLLRLCSIIQLFNRLNQFMPMEQPDTQKKQKRAKIKLQFPEKLFYEKVLAEWKDNIEERNHAYVIKKALNNLKLFPLNVHGFTELRKIRGIGEDIATRLDAAWKYACDSQFKSDTPDVKQITTLTRGDFFQFLVHSAASINGRKRNIVPFVPKQRYSNAINKQNNTAGKSTNNQLISAENSANPTSSKYLDNNSGENENSANLLARFNSHEPYAADHNLMDYDDLLSTSISQPAISFGNGKTSPKKCTFSPNKNQPSTSIAPRFPATILSNQMKNCEYKQTSSAAVLALDGQTEVDSSIKTEQFLSFSPEQFDGQSRVFLVTDNRENIAGARSKRKGKGVGEHLLDMGVSCDNRVLSVGDYLWILQWTNCQGQKQELVLDYVVERKTWDDLKKSIRETRYLEQKYRLRRCGLRNVIMVVEGGFNADRSLEQAIVSTSVENGFLIHRTQNMQSTAKFLQHLTKRLEERCKREKVSGPSFESLQEKCKKPKPSTVSDCWLRQLTVCPGMSLDRAQLIRQQFPSLRTLSLFYKNERIGEPEEDQKLLSRKLPLLPVSISKQMHTFFHQAISKGTK